MEKQYSFKKLAVDLVYDFVGCLLYATAVYTFILASNFTTGGISGLALSVNRLFNLPVGIVSFSLNIPIILISYKVLGKLFLLKSLKTMIVLTFCLDYIGPRLPKYQGNVLLAVICAGICIGLALGVVYMRGSSTGGADFLILSIRKKKPHLSIGNISVSIDAVILLIGGLSFQNVDAALYGALTVFIATRVIDFIMYGSASGKMLFVVTSKGDDVARAIYSCVGRGSTIADIRGSYAGQPLQLVLSAVSKSQLFSARKAAHQVDESSFIMISPTDEVFGQGFVDPRGD